MDLREWSSVGPSFRLKLGRKEVRTTTYFTCHRKKNWTHSLTIPFLKSIEWQEKAYDQEDAFIKRNDIISILTIYFIIFARGQDTSIWRWTKLKKDSIKITLFGNDKNSWRISRVHSRRLSIILGFLSTLLWFFYSWCTDFSRFRKEKYQKEGR